MNFHVGAVFNTFLHNNHETLPFIPAFISIAPDMVHLQKENIRQDIQDFQLTNQHTYTWKISSMPLMK